MKANEKHYFSNLFDKVLYMIQTCSLSIIRSISALYTCNRYRVTQKRELLKNPTKIEEIQEKNVLTEI